MKLSSGVFETRTGSGDTLSARVFYFCLSLSVIWGLFMTSFFAKYAVSIGFHPTGWVVPILIGLVIPMVGVFISLGSEIPIVSFFGYNLIVIPFGFLLGPALQHVRPEVVSHACDLTALVTLIMGTLGLLFPSFFSRIGGALFAALLGLVIVRILQLFIPELQHLGFIEYISAGIFSLYIGFDMWRASTIEKTLDNAIDVSVALYLDIINLFLTFVNLGDD